MNITMTVLLNQKKRFLLLLAGLLSIVLAKSQTIVARDSRKVKNIIWFTPNGANQINGIAVGIQALNVKGEQLVINGLNADAGLLSCYALGYVVHDLLSPAEKRTEKFMEFDTASTIINGLSMSMGGEVEATINGINLAYLITGAVSLNGLSVTGLFSRCKNFRGIVLSGIHNKAKKGIGLQIALFNKCEKLHGLQIGLWNKSGKRGLPFFNWGI
jgi:hypothetical protein